jgi:hypothetical protein
MAEQSAVSGLVNRAAATGSSSAFRAPETANRAAAVDDRLPNQRSAVTNGQRLFVRGSQGDGNGAWARRMRDVIALHVSDLGGWDNVTEAEKSILRRAATLTVELERLEARFSNSDHSPRDCDLQTYQRLTNTLRRALEAVGIHRRPRDVTPPTLDSYLDSLSRSKVEQNAKGGAPLHSQTHSSGAQTSGRE